MRVPLFFLVLPAFLGACGYVDRYEKAVHDFEPVYCYRYIGKIECYKTPRHGDERRLVNYYGPHPSRYERPPPPPPPNLQAPPPIDFYVRDPEPIPEPAPPRIRAGASTGTGTGVLTAPALPPTGAPARLSPPPGPVEDPADPAAGGDSQ